MRDMIINTRSPMGIPLKTNGSWCNENRLNSTKIVYSGALNVTMSIVSRAGKILPFLLKNPINESRIRFIGNFSFFSKIFLRLPIFQDKKMVRVPKHALQILHKIGYDDINCLKEEPYSGVLLYDLGFHQELIEYGKYLRDYFNSYNIEEIILIDPHTYELFNEVYQKIIPGFSFKINLILDLLVENITKLSLNCNKNINENNREFKVTYHDPCIYAKRLTTTRINTPRELIRSIENVELTDPFNHGRTSKCCGGPLEFLFADLSKEISKKRLDELKETGAKNVVTSCPICYVSFKRIAGRDMDVIDLIDLLYESMEPNNNG